MAKQTVDTERIAAAVSTLRTANNNINSALQELQGKAKQLDANWNSQAGDKAMTAMYQLLQNNTVRSSVLENYIRLLEQQVNPGYNSAETINKKLADQFK